MSDQNEQNSAAIAADDKKLFARLRQGDEKAREALIAKYSTWVNAVVRKYHISFPSMDHSELVAEGNHGLLEAMERFDPSRGVKFSTYAWFWIVKNIQEYITSTLSIIGVPGNVKGELRKVIASINEELKKGNEPSLKEIAHKLDLDVDTVSEMLADKKNLSNPVSLDKYLDDENKEETLADIIEDKNLKTIQTIMDQMDDALNVSELLDHLEPLEKAILRSRFGFDDSPSTSLKDIAHRHNISPAKAKDIETIAIYKLKKLIDRTDKYDVSNN